MVKYSCEKCRKFISQKSHYDSHNKRKTPCEKNVNKNIKAGVDKEFEENLKELNNKKLIIKNGELNNNIDRMQPQNTQKKEVKYIDLFCGLGAYHTAFNRNNELQNEVKYTCVLASDINEGVRNIYEENYGIKPEGDINKINIDTIPDFDILCAGFPCQPFSIAGNQKGFEDETRGNLFYKILEIVDKKQPSVLMLENVKNLYTIHKGETFKIIKNEIEKRGYNVSYKVIDSRYYNSPQSRQRIYIICNKNKKYIFREIKNPIVPVSTIIDNSVKVFFDYKTKYKLEKCTGNMAMKYKLINKKTGKGGRQGERVYDLKKCGPTICASSGGPGAKTGLYYFNGKIRKLTVVEALKMFGFNDTYKYETLQNKKDMLFYLGNSIVVNVLEELIKDL
jgi:DNA (cytosine-5)-methyltransferase 1